MASQLASGDLISDRYASALYDLAADKKVVDSVLENLLSIKKVIDRYKNSEINSILVEAGPKLVNSFLSEGLVDELIIYESPDALGSNGVNWFEEDNAVENFGFKLESSYKIESDLKKIYKNVKR